MAEQDYADMAADCDVLFAALTDHRPDEQIAVQLSTGFALWTWAEIKSRFVRLHRFVRESR